MSISYEGNNDTTNASTSHIEDLWYNEKVCMWFTIYTPLPYPRRGWALWQRSITLATRIIQISSNEVSAPAPDSAKCKQTKFDVYPLILKLTLSRRLDLGVCLHPDVKLGGFRSRLGATHVSSYTEELWYNEKVCLWMTIYIQCITKMSTPLTFLQKFKYISLWENTDKMTLWHNEK